MKTDKNIDVLFVYTNINGFHLDVYNFGIGYLSSVLKKNGFTTKLAIARTKDDYRDVVELTAALKPKVVGFSSVSSQFIFVAELAQMIRNACKDCVIVCGGVHPTIFPECLTGAPALDGVFIGESETAFLDFVSAVASGKDFKKTNNYCYRNGSGLIKNKLNPRITHLEELPFPDREIYDYQSIIDDNDGVATLMTNRGCPFDCTYCSNHAIARAYAETRNYTRYAKPEYVLDEIGELQSHYRFNKLWFEDDLFILNKQWLNTFLEGFKKRFSYQFMCHIRPDVCTREILFQLKGAGCYKIFLAVESANDHIRNTVMKRNISKEQLENCFRWAKEASIETLSVNIIGVPGETEETIRETIAFNKKMNPTIIGVNVYSPYLGTELGDFCRQNNLINNLAPDVFHDRRQSVLRLPTISNKKLMSYYERFHYLVYKGVDKEKERRFFLQLWGSRYRRLEKIKLFGFVFKKLKSVVKRLAQRFVKTAP